MHDDFTVHDSGERRTFATGSRRDMAKGKGRFDLISARFLLRLAKHFEAGAVKYGDRNWEKGMPLHVFIDSTLRHIARYMMGQRSEDHLTAAAWNLQCFIDTEERIREGLLPESLDEANYLQRIREDPPVPPTHAKVRFDGLTSTYIALEPIAKGQVVEFDRSEAPQVEFQAFEKTVEAAAPEPRQAIRDSSNKVDAYRLATTDKKERLKL